MKFFITDCQVKRLSNPLPELGFIPRSGSKNAKNSIFQRLLK
ncbi:MAG: hypothetical protein ACKO3R_08800 [bacterium]